jgi:hypothetical protein
MAKGEVAGKKVLRRERGVPQLLYSRLQTAQALGNVSVSTIRRLQAAGRLTPIKLSPDKEGAVVFYRADEVHALAEGRIG